MRRILIVILIVSSLLPVYSATVVPAEDEELNPAALRYDLYGRSVLMGDDLNFGGGISIGVETPNFVFEVYGQGDYFLFPLGSKGTAAALEFDIEAGITLGWKFLKFWHFDTYVACDIGYYMQFVQTHYQPDGYTIGFNGIMLRPKLMTELNIGKWYGISLGVFYQFPLYPGYDRYRGIGIMVSIL